MLVDVVKQGATPPHPAEFVHLKSEHPEDPEELEEVDEWPAPLSVVDVHASPLVICAVELHRVVEPPTQASPPHSILTPLTVHEHDDELVVSVPPLLHAPIVSANQTRASFIFHSIRG